MKRPQQGHLVKISGTWCVRYRDIERGKDGAVRTVNRSHRIGDGKLRRADALEIMRDYIGTRVNAGIPVEAGSTIASFIVNEFLPDKKANCAPSTYQGYLDIWKCHGPALDPKARLRDFTTYDGQQLMRLCAKRAHLSRGTLKHIKGFFSTVFTHALRLGFIDSGNPMRYVEVPKEGAPTEDTYAYSPDEIEAMLKVLPEPANTLVMFAAHTGLRRSEIRGLIWADWQGDTISVTRSMWKKHIRETKSKASRAPIPVSRELQARLTVFKPPFAMPSDPMFLGLKGKAALNISNVARRIIIPRLALCAHCELSKDRHAQLTHRFVTLPQWHGWHGFRRGLASFLHHKGVDDMVIQRLLRHSNVAVTQACYIKVVSQDVRNAMEKIEGAFTSTGKLPETEGAA